MARTIPNKGYGGIYGTEAAGKTPNDGRTSRAKKAADDFALAENSASGQAPQVNDNSTTGSTDIAENGGSVNTPSYDGASSLTGSTRGSGAMTAVAKATPMGKIASMFRGNGESNGNSKKPLIAMGSLTGIIGLLMLLVSSSLPLHLLENFADLRNTMGTQTDLRGTKLIKHLFNSKNDAESLFKNEKRSRPKKW